jgi:tRNA-splicing ligase RtcB (3'-phosphate/5'-hydroxy nucleic acid ligase)
MMRGSYLMVGQGNPLTFCSCCHGAGRARSRKKSSEMWKGRDTFEYMSKQGVTVLANAQSTVAEEMPDAYKMASSVVKAVQKAELAKMVALLLPRLVIKG